MDIYKSFYPTPLEPRNQISADHKQRRVSFLLINVVQVPKTEEGKARAEDQGDDSTSADDQNDEAEEPRNPIWAL